MPVKIAPFEVVETLNGLDHQHYIGLACDFHNLGWESLFRLQPTGDDTTPGQLIIAVRPDYSVFETASEQH